MIRRFVKHVQNVAARSANARAPVTSSDTGGALGSPPAIGGGVLGNAWRGGDGFADGRGVTHYINAPDIARHRPLPPKKPPAVILPDVVEGQISVAYDADLWWAAQRPAIDQLAGRHTRTPIEGWGSRMAYGSSDVASGPEGTMVLFPPRLPRQLATGRSVAGARAGGVLLNAASDHMQTPDVPVVAAAYGRSIP